MQPTWVVAALLCFYAVLAVWFAAKGMYPFSAYYVGCVVKDAAVFVLAVLNTK